MRKVLFVASTASHILNFHLPYLSFFKQKGWEVHVACGTEINEIPGCDKIIVLPMKKKMFAVSNLKVSSKLHRLFLKENYSIISTHTSLASFFVRLSLFGISKRPRVINMVHGYLFDERTSFLKKNLLYFAEKIVAGKTDLIMTMNDWDDIFAKKHHLARKIVKIPGVGFDPHCFVSVSGSQMELKEKYRLPKECFVVLCVAELSKRKNQIDLIQATKKLPKEIVVLLAGKGECEKHYRDIINQESLHNRVFLLGHVDQIEELYTLADVVVSCSKIEGLPFNVMEAMYMGVPLVVSDAKGNCDLIQDRFNGLTYPCGENEKLAFQINSYYESKALREKMKTQAYKDVQKHQLSMVYPVVTKYYEEVMEGVDE